MSSAWMGDGRLPAEQNTYYRYVVLLIHEGGPMDLSFSSIASFLASELSTRRAVDTLPRWLWLPLLYTFVLPWKTPQMRRIYEATWLPERAVSSSGPGSSWLGRLAHSLFSPSDSSLTLLPTPVGASSSVYYCRKLVNQMGALVHAVCEAHGLLDELGQLVASEDVSIQVDVAFTHQKGSFDTALERFTLFGNYMGVKDSNNNPAVVVEEKLIAVPLYPQYSSLRSAVAFDALTKASFFGGQRSVPHVSFVRSYACHRAYIKAIEIHVRQFFAEKGMPEWLFVVFDGLPQRFVLSGDVYQVECRRTYEALRMLLSQPFEAPDYDDIAFRGWERFCKNPLRVMDTSALPASRVTVSFLAAPAGFDASLEPRTTRVLNGLTKQVLQLERSTPSSSCSLSETPRPIEMLSSVHFVCPGITVDDARSHYIIQEKLLPHSLRCGWRHAEVVPSLNGSDLHAAMLMSVVSDHIH